MAGALVVAVGRRPQVFHTRAPWAGCLSVLTTWWLTFLRGNQAAHLLMTVSEKSHRITSATFYYLGGRP